VDADIESLANLLNLKAVNGGANVSLLLPYDEGVFYQARSVRRRPEKSVDGQAIASGIQLYLDLLGFLRGRSSNCTLRTGDNATIVAKRDYTASVLTLPAPCCWNWCACWGALEMIS